mmetsp:Transcript_17309/g.54737  ORF Transcript_17309/g.54737 Transcript_17309/m.54737 type:complete len:178 (-) Transcript_17309:39-572(-)
MQGENGCRWSDPALDAWGRCLHVFGAAVCACLFCLGFLMFKLPFDYGDQYSTGQWLSCVAQGVAIMLITVAAFVDSIYSTECIGRNFGFLSHTCGRTGFYLLMGLYALPVMETLNNVSEHHGEDGYAASFALAGVILTFFAGILHGAVLLRQRFSGDAKYVPEERAMPQRVGAGASA